MLIDRRGSRRPTRKADPNPCAPLGDNPSGSSQSGLAVAGAAPWRSTTGARPRNFRYSRPRIPASPSGSQGRLETAAEAARTEGPPSVGLRRSSRLVGRQPTTAGATFDLGRDWIVHSTGMGSNTAVQPTT